MKLNKKLITLMASITVLSNLSTVIPEIADLTQTQTVKADIQKIGHAEVQYKDYDLPIFSYRHGTGKPEGIVVHEVGNPNSTIWNEIQFMLNNYGVAFVHAYADANNIIQVHNTDYGAWGAGPSGNSRFIHIELVEAHNWDDFAKSVNNQAYYVALMLKKYGLTPSLYDGNGNGTIWTHHNVSNYFGDTDHVDPTGYWAGWGFTIQNFFELVKGYYQDLSGNTNDNNNTPDPNKPTPESITNTTMYVKNNSGASVFNSPYYDGTDTGRKLEKNSAWIAYQKVNIKGTIWYALGTGSWVKENDMTTTQPPVNKDYVEQQLNGVITINNGIMSQVYSKDSNNKMVSVRGKKLPATSGWYTDTLVKTGGHYYYRVATNEWVQSTTGEFTDSNN